MLSYIKINFILFSNNTEYKMRYSTYNDNYPLQSDWTKVSDRRKLRRFQQKTTTTTEGKRKANSWRITSISWFSPFSSITYAFRFALTLFLNRRLFFNYNMLFYNTKEKRMLMMSLYATSFCVISSVYLWLSC